MEVVFVDERISELKASDQVRLRHYFAEMCSGSEEGSYLRLIDFVYHSTLGVRVIKKKSWPLGSTTRWATKVNFPLNSSSYTSILGDI